MMILPYASALQDARVMGLWCDCGLLVGVPTLSVYIIETRRKKSIALIYTNINVYVMFYTPIVLVKCG